jgi:transcriptional regulator GlxA family with amidase domain
MVCIPAGSIASRSPQETIEAAYVLLDDIPLWSRLKDRGPIVRKYEFADMLHILVSSIVGALVTQDIYSIRCAHEDSETLVKLLKRELHEEANERDTRHSERLTGLVEKIREHPDAKWDSYSMAQEINMSQRNMNRAFRKKFNMPPAKMVTTIRMDLAARMLIETDMSLATIANTLGYDSPFSFSRLFKKHAGISPNHYRALPAGQRQPTKPTKAK